MGLDKYVKATDKYVNPNEQLSINTAELNLVKHWEGVYDVYRYMVKTTGSANNTGLTWDSPKSCVKDVIDILPANLNGKTVWIFVEGGIYAGELTIRNYNTTIYIVQVTTALNAGTKAWQMWAKNDAIDPIANDDPITFQTPSGQPLGTFQGANNSNLGIRFLCGDLEFWEAWWNSNYKMRYGAFIIEAIGAPYSVLNIWGLATTVVWFDTLILKMGGATNCGIQANGQLWFESLEIVGGAGGASTGTGAWKGAIVHNSDNSGVAIDPSATVDPAFPLPSGKRVTIKDCAQFMFTGQTATNIFTNINTALFAYVNTGSGITSTNYLLGVLFSGKLNYLSAGNITVTDGSEKAHTLVDGSTGIVYVIMNNLLKKKGTSITTKIVASAPADSVVDANEVVAWLDETNHKLNYKAKYSNGSTVKSGSIDLVAPKEYTALLSETGYAATSGALISGQTYYIASYVAGDDFTNVGGTNVTGNTFVASGTTPTTWTNSSILVSVGISAPAVTLLTNGLSGAIVWTYSAVGTYIGTLSGAFTENKTVFQYPPLGDDKAVTVEWTSANVITVKTYETGALKDGLLVKFPLTIKVYP